MLCKTNLKDFSILITDCVPDLQLQFNGQCFPLYYYEENTTKQKGLFDGESKDEYIRRDAISDFILERAKKQGDITVILAPSNAVNRIGEHSGRIIQLPDDSWLPNILDHKIEKIENIIKLGKTVERKCAALYDPVSNPLGPGNIQLSTASQNLLASCS